MPGATLHVTVQGVLYGITDKLAEVPTVSMNPIREAPRDGYVQRCACLGEPLSGAYGLLRHHDNFILEGDGLEG